MNYKKILLWLVLVTVVVTAAASRYMLLGSHFSHVDDVIAPHIIIFTDLQAGDRIPESAHVNENFRRIMKYFLTRSLLQSFMIAQSSTYAPLQFTLTSFFVNDSLSYREALKGARFPSFLFSMFSLPLVFLIFRRINPKQWLAQGLFSAAILAFSWMFIIYSVQSNPYAAGVFALLLLMLIVLLFAGNPDLKLYKIYIFIIITALLMFLNYQILFMMPAFFITLVFIYRNKLKKFFYRFTVPFLMLAAAVYVLFRLFLRGKENAGVHWNAGPGDEFLIQYMPDRNTADTLIYILNFFIRNTYIVLRSLVSAASEGNPLNDVIALLFLVLMIAGILYAVFSKSEILRSLAVFFISASLTWGALVLMQKITLSPTRHSLILLSFIAVFVPLGIASFTEILKNIKYSEFIYAVPAALLAAVFMYDYGTEAERRKDKLDEQRIADLIRTFQPEIVHAYGWTHQIYLMKTIRDSFKMNASPGVHAVFSRENPSLVRRVFFISHRNEKPDPAIVRSYFRDGRYSVLYESERTSDTEICQSSLTRNGTNSEMIYVMEGKK